MDKIGINEVFISYQGEGNLVGKRCLFIRLAGCPLRCYWCDTDYALTFKNAKFYSIDELYTEVITLLNQDGHIHHISLTGGEPLLQYQQLYQFLSKYKDNIPKLIHLESSCNDYIAFKTLLEYIDIVKIEFKLPDTKAVKDFNILYENEMKCLKEVILHEIPFYIKFVIASTTDLNEFTKYINDIKRIAGEYDYIPILRIYLQPEYNSLINDNENLMKKIDELYNIIHNELNIHPEVLPQIHKFMNLR